MENKNNSLLFGLAFLLVGLFVGWLMFGVTTYRGGGMGIHMMPNGKMMMNSGMSMRDMMASMNANLYGKTGDSFDKAFLEEMIMHHEGAVEMAQLALKNAKHEEIKNLSTDIISAQNKEISQMKLWLSTWYGN